MSLSLAHTITDEYSYMPEFRIGKSSVKIELSKEVLALFEAIVKGETTTDATDGPIHVYVDETAPLTLRFMPRSGEVGMEIHIDSDNLPTILAQVLHAHYYLRDLAADAAAGAMALGELGVANYVKGKICGKVVPAETVVIHVY